jgi:hypothetical protein
MLGGQVRHLAARTILGGDLGSKAILRPSALCHGTGLTALREIVRTNDPVLISAIEALFTGAHIPYMVLDQNMSVLEGSIGMLPRRILVDDAYEREARTLMTDAGLGKELRPEKP